MVQCSSKLLTAALVVILTTAGFTGCGITPTGDTLTIDAEPSSNSFSITSIYTTTDSGGSTLIEPGGPGFELGFARGTGMFTPIPPPVMCAAKSNYSVFNVNNLVLDFYYGGFGSTDARIYDGNPDNYELVCVALYFCNERFITDSEYYDYTSGAWVYRAYKDYTEIDDWYFVRELPPDEINSGEYVYTYQFNHRETIKVPSTVLERAPNNACVFLVASISYSKKVQGYCLRRLGNLTVRYEYIDQQTIRILP